MNERFPNVCFGHVLGRWIISHIPARRVHRSVSAGNRLPYACGPNNKMAAAAGNTGWRAVIAARNTTVKKIVRHGERPSVAEPAARDGGSMGQTDWCSY